MTMRDVMNDHGLDARDEGNGFYTTTCPVCISQGLLGVNMRNNTFQCRNPRCRASGDAHKLDRLFRRVRANEKLR